MLRPPQETTMTGRRHNIRRNTSRECETAVAIRCSLNGDCAFSVDDDDDDYGDNDRVLMVGKHRSAKKMGGSVLVTVVSFCETKIN